MTSLTDIDGSVFAYEFDGEGNRLSQSLNDCLSKRFVYDGADVLLELNPTNGVAYAWVNGPGIDQPIERLLFIDGSPRARRVFHADALGSVAALTDPSGHVAQSYTYSAFGSLRSSNGPDPNRVTYTGREQLGDSQEWMYYRYRIYDSANGRFVSEDPLGLANGPNLFAYVHLAPLRGIDPWGLQSSSMDPRWDAYTDGKPVAGTFQPKNSRPIFAPNEHPYARNYSSETPVAYKVDVPTVLLVSNLAAGLIEAGFEITLDFLLSETAFQFYSDVASSLVWNYGEHKGLTGGPCPEQ